MTVISECVCLQVVFVSGIPHNSRRDWSIHFDFIALLINSRFILLMLLVCFHFIVKQQQKLSSLSLFMQKTMEVEPEKHEDGLDKDDSEAWEVSSISQPPELQEPIGDSLDDFSCSKFQYHTCGLTETIFEMTQFKMPCGPLLLYQIQMFSKETLLTFHYLQTMDHNKGIECTCMLCGSKNYPYLPPQKGFFLRPLPPPGNSSQASYIYLNFWAFENPPSPRNFQSLLWGEYGYFVELHIITWCLLTIFVF